MNNVVYNDKQNWQLNEVVNPQDVNKWEKGIADVVALANYLNTTDIPGIQTTIATLAKKDLSNLTTAAEQRLIPVGALMMGPVTTMDGFLLCNGQAVSRTDYSALYALIGTSFGAGDGSTTFNVPDYRGCFLRGLGGSSAANMYTKQPMGAPNISGNFYGKGDFAYNDFYVSGALKQGEYHQRRDAGQADVHTYPSIELDASSSNSIYGAANEIRPVNFAINYFIKY